MRVTVCFYSYFKDLAGSSAITEELPEGRGDVAERAVSTSDRLVVPDEVIRTRNCQLVESAS